MKAERRHDKLLNRIEYRVYSDVYNCMYRIFRSYDKKLIVVIKHDKDFSASDFILEISARGPFNSVYESQGNRYYDYAANGKYGWSLRDAVAHQIEQIEAGRA